MWKIYKITNIINNKIYIGITKRALKRRFYEHTQNKNGLLYNSISKYGKQNFSIQQIDESDTLLYALFKESNYISQHASYEREKGYNLIKNSFYMEFTEEVKLRLIEALKNKKKLMEENPYIGVFFIKYKKRWCFKINALDKKACIKNFKTCYDAAIARDIYLVENYDKEVVCRLMNFPEMYKNIQDGKINFPERQLSINYKKSKYSGVFFEKRFQKWRVRIDKTKCEDKDISFSKGLIDDEKDAAELSDYIKVNFYKNYAHLNFPEKIDLYKSENYKLPLSVIEKSKKIKYKNISIEKQGYYRVYIEFKGKLFRKTAKTLEDAVKERNLILNSIGRKIPLYN
jgi:hypothetical protein